MSIRPRLWRRPDVVLAALAAALAVAGVTAIVIGVATPAGAQPAPPLARVRPKLLAPGAPFFVRTPVAGAPASPAAPPPPAPRVAMLATLAGTNRTELIFQPLDKAEPAPPVARFTHLMGTAVLGAVVPQSTNVLVIAGTEARRDPAFGASMLLMGEGQEPKLVTSGVYRGTRPLVLDDGRAFVQRGVEGAEPSEEDLAAGRLRVDHLSIEEIDLKGGAPKVLSQFEGYIAFIAGALRREIFVYRVGPDGADIIGLDADSGRARTIQRPLPPYARDFSVDAQGQTLLFTNADEQSPGTWVAEQLNVAPPAAAAPVVAPTSRVAVMARRQRLATAPQPGLAPTAWGDGEIATSGNLTGLRVMRKPGPGPDKVAMDLGSDVVREFFTSRQATFAIAMHHEPGALPQPVVIQTKTLDVQKVAVPPGARVDVAGVLSQADVARPQIREIQMAPPQKIRISPRLLRPYIAPVDADKDDDK